MKKIIFLPLAVLAACSTIDTSDKFIPTAAMAQTSGTPLSDLQDGHAIFMVQCSQCHEQRIPNSLTSDEWHTVTPGMAWNAGLSKEERAKVTKYLVAASKVK